MPRRCYVKKEIKISKHKFFLEIYYALEGHKELCWEVFPFDNQASLYAFENKNKIEKIVERKHLYEISRSVG